MAGNIPGTRYSTKDFINKFGNLAQSSQYRSHIVLPSEVQSFLQSKRIFSRQILSETGILCKATSLPGSSLATHDVKDFYGVTQKHAYARQFDGTIDLTFYVDSDYQMLYLFEFWMEFIMQLNGQNPRGGNSYFKASFPDEYRSSLFVYKFNKDQDSFLPGQGRGNITYEFINAFPQNISSVGVSYDASNVLEFTVTFAYERYITDRSGIFRPQVASSNNQATRSAPQDNPSAESRTDDKDSKLVNRDPAPESDRFLGAPTEKGLNSQQTLNELYEAGRSGKIKSASQFIGPLQ